MINQKTIDQEIINHRGDVNFLNELQNTLRSELERLSWIIEKFLRDKCKGITELERLDLDASDPLYRFYNSMRHDYEQINRLIRVAEAYK